MAYDNNAFCWFGVVSTDTTRAAAFYGETIGWKAVPHTFESGDTTTMLVAGDASRGHLRAPGMAGEPSHWEAYLRVESVDASTKASTVNGGKVLVPPTDIPPGRFSVVTSPSGAPVALFHEADEATAKNGPPGTGSVHWTELHSRNLQADLAWLKGAFGFDVAEMPMPNGTYHLLQVNGENRGGALTGMNPEAPAMWLSWVQVDNCDEALARVKNSGGKGITDPMDFPSVGRMAVVADPLGAVFGIITPAS